MRVRISLLRLAEERLRVDLVLVVAVGVRGLLLLAHDMVHARVHYAVFARGCVCVCTTASERSLCPASLSSDEG